MSEPRSARRAAALVPWHYLQGLLHRPLALVCDEETLMKPLALLASLTFLSPASVLAQDAAALRPAQLAGAAQAACWLRAASTIDDGVSGADVIAAALGVECYEFEGQAEREDRSSCPAALSFTACEKIIQDVSSKQRIVTVLKVRAWRLAHPERTPPWASASAAAACPHPDQC